MAENKESATDNLLKALSNIYCVPPLSRQETSKPYHRRTPPPQRINNDTSNNFTSLMNEISSINSNYTDSYTSLLNSFQSFDAGSSSGTSLLGLSTSSAVTNSTIPAPTVSTAAAAPITIANLTDILIDIVKPVIPPPRKTFDCLICYTKFYEDEGALACSTPPESETVNENAEKHLICVTCIRGYAHNSIFDGPVAHGGSGLKCVEPGCENVLLLYFEHYLSDEDYVPLKTRLQEQCLLDAGLADLVTCPECSYKIIVEQSLTCYTCNCGRIQCRNCPRAYDEQHQNRTCEEMAQLELQQASMRRIEPQMSEILIRKCHKCNVAFIKTHGCNKMTCARCGATSCYICRQPDINYNHFCNCGASARTHGPCRTCGKSCRNNERVDELDQQAMNRLQQRVNV